MPKEKVVLLISGPYSKIEKCDERILGKRDLKIVVLPGVHTVELSFLHRQIGNLLFYSYEKGEVTFEAEAGQSYLIYAEILPSNTEWIVKVEERGSSKIIAKSEPLSLKVEVLQFGGDGYPYHGDIWQR